MYETELYLTFLETFQQFENRMKAFDPQWIAFKNFVKTGIQFAVCTKTRMPAVSPPPEGSTTDFPFFFVKFASRCGFGVMHCLFHLNQSFKFTVFSKAFCSSFQRYWFFPWKVRFF